MPTIAPVTALQRAVIKRFESDTDLPADLTDIRAELDVLVEQRIFSNAPDDTEFPYIEMGRAAIDDEDENCSNVESIEQQIIIWSRDGGWTEARTIASLVKLLLHDREIDIELETHALRVLRASRKEEVDDPDGRTVRVVVIIYAEVEDLNG